MIETNDYGMYSGGYIFDQMDRAALQYIKHEAGLPDDAVIVTMAANVQFKRQLCDKYAMAIRCFDFHITKLYSTLYTCKVEILANMGEIIAEASFIFTSATNHCELKGEKNDTIVAGTIPDQGRDMGTENQSQR